MKQNIMNEVEEFWKDNLELIKEVQKDLLTYKLKTIPQSKKDEQKKN